MSRATPFIIGFLLMMLASPLTSADISQATSPQVSCVTGQAPCAYREPVVVWSQLPDLAEGSWYTSSVRLSDGYWAESADDFRSDYSASITSVEWWGAYGPPAELLYVIVQFYLDAPGSRTNAPGALVYQESIYTLVGEQVTGGSGSDYRYTADLPVQFTISAGTTYWVSIQGVEQSGQWYWYECVVGDYWGEEGSIRSEFWGIPDWVLWSDFGSEHVEFAFALHADSSPVEAASWASIKALFR